LGRLIVDWRAMLKDKRFLVAAAAVAGVAGLSLVLRGRAGGPGAGGDREQAPEYENTGIPVTTGANIAAWWDQQQDMQRQQWAQFLAQLQQGAPATPTPSQPGPSSPIPRYTWDPELSKRPPGGGPYPVPPERRFAHRGLG
jgi:hypothetical protein